MLVIVASLAPPAPLPISNTFENVGFGKIGVLNPVFESRATTTRGPSVAVVAIVTFAVNWFVPALKATSVTVMLLSSAGNPSFPSTANLIVSIVDRFEPLIWNANAAPSAAWLAGPRLVIDGRFPPPVPPRAPTKNSLPGFGKSSERSPDVPFLTITNRGPSGAILAIVTFTVIWVALLMVTELIAKSGSNCGPNGVGINTPPPSTPVKLAPVMTTSSVSPALAVAGATDWICGFVPPVAIDPILTITGGCPRLLPDKVSTTTIRGPSVAVAGTSTVAVTMALEDLVGSTVDVIDVSCAPFGFWESGKVKNFTRAPPRLSPVRFMV